MLGGVGRLVDWPIDRLNPLPATNTDESPPHHPIIQVRFYIPPGLEENEEGEAGAEAFHKKVLERTNVQQSTTGDALVTFSEEEVRFSCFVLLFCFFFFCFLVSRACGRGLVGLD